MGATKKILIGIGITTLLLLIGVWGYLFLFGTPESVQEITSDLGFQNGGTEFTPIAEPTNRTNEEITLSLSNKIVAQLTTKAIAGFGIDQNVSVPLIRYAERGTGHIYEIDLTTGLEKRVSGSTLGQTVEAYFNKGLDLVVLVAEDRDSTRAILYRIDDETGDKLLELPDRSWNFHFDSSNNLYYLTISESGTTAFEYEIDSGNTSTLWSTPLRDINVYWTEKDTLIVNRPAPRLKSSVYGIRNGSLYSILDGKYDLSLTSDPTGQFLLYSFFEPNENRRESYILDRNSGESGRTDLSAIPEKCTFLTNDGFVCASSARLENAREMTTAWYRGEFVSSDTLWKQGDIQGSVEPIAFLNDLIGFYVDVTNLVVSSDDNLLFFRNKTNDTLWLYRFEEETVETEPITTDEGIATTTDASGPQTPEQ